MKINPRWPSALTAKPSVSESAVKLLPPNLALTSDCGVSKDGIRGYLRKAAVPAKLACAYSRTAL